VIEFLMIFVNLGILLTLLNIGSEMHDIADELRKMRVGE
jgi:hypothetical protein